MAKLGEMTGVSTNTIYRWEADENTPNDKTKKLLVQILGTSIAYLMEETDYPYQPMGTLHEATSSWVEIPVLNPPFTACTKLWDGGIEEMFMDSSEAMLVSVYDLGEIGEHKPFAVRVEGDSMSEAGIPDGAKVAINPEEAVFSGDAILVKWGHRGDLAVKWFYEYDDRIELRSSNPAKYPPIILNRNVIKSERKAGNYEYFLICGKVMVVNMKPKRGI